MDIRAIDLNLLVLLEALLRSKSVSRAAEELNMSQPAVSSALARLRKMLSDPLFIRGSHSMQPTSRALELARPLHAVLDSIKNDLLQPSLFEAATAQRILVMNMSDIGELVFLPKLLNYVRRAAPGVAIRIVTTPPNELEPSLQSGEVDLAVGYFPTLKGASMYQQRLFGHMFVCAVRADHPLVGPKITRRQFEDALHAIVEGKTNDVFEDALAANNLRRRVVLTVPHYLAIPVIVRDSDVVVTVPYAIGASFAGVGGLRVMRPPIQVEMPVLHQYWHARFHHDPFNQWLRGVVASLFLEAPRRSSRLPVNARKA